MQEHLYIYCSHPEDQVIFESPNICEIIWFDTIHRCTILSEWLKPTIPPEPFWSLLMVCSISWSDDTLLKLPNFLHTEKSPAKNSL